MASNPYAPPSGISETTTVRRWHRRVASAIANRFSLLYVAGSVFGVVAGISYRAGIWTALQDIATDSGGLFFAFFSLLATIASLISCPNERFPKFKFARLTGGFSFGLFSVLVEPFVNRFSRAHPDSITPLLGFVLTLIVGLFVSVIVQTLFSLGMTPTGQLATQADCGSPGTPPTGPASGG